MKSDLDSNCDGVQESCTCNPSGIGVVYVLAQTILFFRAKTKLFCNMSTVLSMTQGLSGQSLGCRKNVGKPVAIVK